MKVNVFKELNAPSYITGGMLLKVTSPKGIRVFREETQQYHYRLHTETIQLYDDRDKNRDIEADIAPGLYWAVIICRTKDLGINWNHYLFKVTEDKIEWVESYLNQRDSSWILEAMPSIKKYFKTHQ